MDLLKSILGFSVVSFILWASLVFSQQAEEQPVTQVKDTDQAEEIEKEPSSTKPAENKGSGSEELKPLSVPSRIRAHGNISLPQDI